jgi:pimeloyl-ACP methyl ester carboxylesterase
MLARFVLLTLLVELAAYVAAGAGLRHAFGWSAATLVALALAVAIGARFALTCLTVFLAWLNRSPRAPEHRIGLAGVPRHVARESAAMLIDNLVYLPWERRVLRPDPEAKPCAHPPVILVHGYMSNRGYFRPLVRWLEAQGVAPVFTPNFPVLFTSIETFADVLHVEIERIATGCEQERVILVCHSMGGLAAREYLRTHGARRVRRLVTIASPHHGTALAAAGLGLNARQMCRGCGFLAALEKSEKASPPAVETLSIYTPHDNLVAPQETSRLEWARNLAIAGEGHVAVRAAQRTFDAVLAELRR